MTVSALSTRGELVGREVPRLWTQPLRPLTPETSLGFEAIEFIEDVLDQPLFPWQRWWLIHALELLPSGIFRFRTVLTLVARQNGKTTLVKCLTLYLMYTGRSLMVLGVAQNLEIARESWEGAAEIAESRPDLLAEVETIRRANGQQEFKLTNGARYRIAAATRKAGRGLPVDMVVMDELREQRTWEAWGALSKTTMAKPSALTIAISNAGDDESVVLNALQGNALEGEDESIGLFEWSAPADCELDDPEAWAQSNPALGHGTLTVRAIRSALATDPPAVFRTEVLCIHVESMADAVVTAGAWESCLDAGMVLDTKGARTALFFDAGMDLGHATLAAAQLGPDGRVRVGVVASWSDVRKAVSELQEWRDRIKPASFGWLPGGPAASVATDLKKLKLDEIRGEDVSAMCQEFAALVTSRGVIHKGNPLLTAHVLGAKKYKQGDGWRFVRRGVGHVDAAYAAAGAVRLARNLPPVKRVMLVTSSA